MIIDVVMGYVDSSFVVVFMYVQCGAYLLNAWTSKKKCKILIIVTMKI